MTKFSATSYNYFICVYAYNTLKMEPSNVIALNDPKIVSSIILTMRVREFN